MEPFRRGDDVAGLPLFEPLHRPFKSRRKLSASKGSQIAPFGFFVRRIAEKHRVKILATLQTVFGFLGFVIHPVHLASGGTLRDGEGDVIQTDKGLSTIIVDVRITSYNVCYTKLLRWNSP